MKKMAYILMMVVMGFGSTGFASTKDSTSPAIAMMQAGLPKAKDTAGLDALVQSLQSSNVVKTTFASTNRKTEGVYTAGAAAITSDDFSKEEPSVEDWRMVLAGLMLVGVIAIRRISG